MDNVTHTLFAITLGRTPLGRTGRGTLAALIISSNAPDIDIVSAAGGGLSYLKWHRGPTHGPLGIAGLALVSAGLVHAGRRIMDRRPKPVGLPPLAGGSDPRNASFGTLVAVSLIGTLFHVLIDFPTSYGTRLLSPFDWHWFAVDWMPIVDIYLLAALAAGVILGRRSKGSERRLAAIVLTVMAANYGIRAAAHRQALVLVHSVLERALPRSCDGSGTGWTQADRWPNDRASRTEPAGLAPSAAASSARVVTTPCLVDIAALPTFTSPFRWRIVEHLSNGYEVRQLDLLNSGGRLLNSNGRLLDPGGRLQDPGRAFTDGRHGFWRRSVRYPDVWTAATFAAARTRTAQVFLGFARFPAARSFVDSSGVSTIRWSDVRFGADPVAEPPRRSIFFNVLIRLDAGGRVLQEVMGR